MYLSHFGLNEPPFRITPHTDFFFAGANRGATLEALLYAITHDEGIVKVSGEVGSGKTMLCRVLMERLPPEVETIYLANPSLSREEILYAIADELKLELNAERTTRLLKELQNHLIELFSAGRRVVVLIDEAHAMPKETLEEIRLLSNLESNRHKLLQIVLFGQPELDLHLGDADMRQLKERITHSFRLEPLVRDDIASYIDFRMRAAGYRGPMVFSRGATRLIAAASEGLTRRVNILADKSLLAAFAHNAHGVTEKEARAAIRDSNFFKPHGPWGRYRIAALGIAAGLVIGILASPWVPQFAGWRAESPAVIAQPALPSNSAHSANAGPETRAADSSAKGATTAPVDQAQAEPAPAAPAPSIEHKSRVAANTAGEQASAAKSPAKATGAVAASEPATITDEPSTQPAEPGMGKLTRLRYEATQDWLKTAPAGLHSIQLLTASAGQLPRLERFLQRASTVVPAEQLYVYSVKIDGQQHYRTAFGEFDEVTRAKEAIQQLPQSLRSQNPYVRSVARMKSQNKQ